MDGADPACSDTRGAPFCRIQGALDAASAGDTVRVAAGTYDLLGETLTVRRSVRLIGSGQGATVLDGGGSHPGPIIEVAGSAEVVEIAGLTLTNRLRTGAARMGPGGVEHRSGRLHLHAVTIRATQGGVGGALQTSVELGELRVERALLAGNRAFVGAGVAIQGAAGTPVTIADSVISDNSAVFAGGGVFVRDGDTVTLDRVRVLDNESGNRGAGIYVLAESERTALGVRSSLVSGNRGRVSGGLDLNGEDVEVTLEGVLLAGNRSDELARAADCWMDPGGRVELAGGNVVGVGEGCGLEPTPRDEVGSVEEPAVPGADRRAAAGRQPPARQPPEQR